MDYPDMEWKGVVEESDARLTYCAPLDLVF